MTKVLLGVKMLSFKEGVSQQSRWK